MLPFKKILCPLDFSENSLKALESAEDMALHFQATLVLIHVVTPVFQGGNIGYNAPSMDFNVSLYQKELNRSAQKSMEQTVEKYLKNAEFDVETRIDTGRAEDKITEAAEEENVDLIIIATHGKTGLKWLLMGSVAEGVIRHAGPPVLIIRISERRQGYSK